MKPSRVTLVVIGLAITVAVGLAVQQMTDQLSPTSRTLAKLRALPMVGVIMAEVPGVEDKLRRAIDEDQRSGDPAQTRTFAAIVELRQSHLAPALRAADDASVIAVVAARTELARHLQKADPAACRELADHGIRRVDKLDAEGERLFRATLSAMDMAFRNGRATGSTARPVPTDQEFVALLASAGFTQADFQKLDRIATTADTEICALSIRAYEATSRLSDDKRGPFARYIVVH